MPNVIDPQLAQVTALCRRYGVRKLELFGSATTGAFDPRTSDLDFLIDFDPEGNDSLFHRYFGLNEDTRGAIRPQGRPGNGRYAEKSVLY